MMSIILPNKALTNIELDDAAHKLNIPHYRGAVCSDELRAMQLHRKECGILNLDDSIGSGTHWCCWFRDNDVRYYFDSYGLPPPDELVRYLNTPGTKGILYSTERIQPANTVICGHLCLWVLKKLSCGEELQFIINNLY